jgi:hypothetical protein
MGIEPTYQLVTGTLVLKTRRPTRRLGTSVRINVLITAHIVNVYVRGVGRSRGSSPGSC